MTKPDDTFYAAVTARDARYDGRFFTGVKTTGIYCRPICPARTPLRKNVTFFACAAAAEEAGFRACRRCRPESAPGTPVWLGPAASVSRALRLIERGALDDGSVGALASQLGIGERYLRRLFTTHLGTSPQAVAASRRAHFARILLDATPSPITQVALASGFRSVRQFNDVIRATFGQTPTALRTAKPPHTGPGARRDAAGVSNRATPLHGSETKLRLAFRPPMQWDALLGFLAARAIPGVESVADGVYRRTFDGSAIAVRLAGDGRALELTVQGTKPAGLFDVVRRVRRLFDLDADPLAIGSALRAAGLRIAPGLRVPGAWDPFETLVRAVVGQQISVAAATTITGRIAQRFGLTAAGLANADLSTVGLTRARAAGLKALSAQVAREPELLGAAPNLEALIDRLTALPGIGPWTAGYVAMRALGEPDAFPAGDLILRRAAGNLTEAQLEAKSEVWRPWRAYAAVHLWSTHAEEKHHAARVLAS